MPSTYEIVTESIIKQLESGVAPWRKPWRTGMPVNLVSKKEYRGINIFLLAFQPEREFQGQLPRIELRDDESLSAPRTRRELSRNRYGNRTDTNPRYCQQSDTARCTTKLSPGRPLTF